MSRSALPGADALLARLERAVVRPFTRRTNLVVVAFPFDAVAEQPVPAPPRHPECGDFQDTTACRRSWDEHVTHLRTHPEVHWHRCPFDKLCAVVPVVREARCVAACKLVCYGAMSDLEFGRHVEHLDVLVQGFIRSDLGQASPDQNPPRQAGHGTAVGRARVGGRSSQAPNCPTPPVHGHVARALRYLQSNLANPALMVKGIADTLELDANYLAHLFRERVGERMTWYISSRRVELAQRLLAASTRMTVQEVALEVGYTNAKAFSQAFRIHVGLSPTEFRRQQTSTSLDAGS